MAFTPPFCPYPECGSRSSSQVFTWYRRGSFRRKCDGRYVARFSCKTCGRRFSFQTYRFDYRWRIPRLHRQLFHLFVAKVTMRQMARMLNVRRPTVERRLLRLGEHCRRLHRDFLDRRLPQQGLTGIFQLDELETFETDRRLKPVTMPILIERNSYFVVSADVAPLGARGHLSPALKVRQERFEAREGVRRSGSVDAVTQCFQDLARFHHREGVIHLESDRKSSYRRIFRELIGKRFGSHTTVHSKKKRDHCNRLFPINHTLAMMRDGISRLVRRSWGASKRRDRLLVHFWIWLVYRNYVRGITVKTKVTPAMALGVTQRPCQVDELLRWRWPWRMPQCGQ